MRLDVTQVARDILDGIDVASAPRAAKLRIVESLLELKRLDVGMSPLSAEPSRKDPIFSWVDNCRAVRRVGHFVVENGVVTLPKDHAYSDYMRHCESVKSVPLCAAQFGKRIRQLAEWGGAARCRAGGGRIRAITLNFN